MMQVRTMLSELNSDLHGSAKQKKTQQKLDVTKTSQTFRMWVECFSFL